MSMARERQAGEIHMKKKSTKTKAKAETPKKKQTSERTFKMKVVELDKARAKLVADLDKLEVEIADRQDTFHEKLRELKTYLHEENASTFIHPTSFEEISVISRGEKIFWRPKPSGPPAGYRGGKTPTKGKKDESKAPVKKAGKKKKES